MSCHLSGFLLGTFAPAQDPGVRRRSLRGGSDGEVQLRAFPQWSTVARRGGTRKRGRLAVWVAEASEWTLQHSHVANVSEELHQIKNNNIMALWDSILKYSILKYIQL